MDSVFTTWHRTAFVTKVTRLRLEHLSHLGAYFVNSKLDNQRDRLDDFLKVIEEDAVGSRARKWGLLSL